jgi:hypothetical protein
VVGEDNVKPEVWSLTIIQHAIVIPDNERSEADPESIPLTVVILALNPTNIGMKE